MGRERRAWKRSGWRESIKIQFYRNSIADMTTEKPVYRTWMCLICGYIYSEEAGIPDEGIAPGTRWEDVPINWTCPECGARKEDFEMVQV
jgi:rubredoxin